MSDLPYKWKKYMLLCECGIASFDDINSRVNRFSTACLPAFFDKIEKELLADLFNYESVLFIVKLVQNLAYYKLPNYRIQNIEDINSMRTDFIKRRVDRTYDEVWFCKNLRVHGQITLSGRFCLYETEEYIAHIIECVWNESPRVIDSYNQYADISYIRAERGGWGHHYTIQEFNVKEADDADTLMELFTEVLLQIEESRNKLTEMFEFCKKSGLDIVSFEFTHDGKTHFIDWDSSDDLRLLRLC